jgi:hypothetical protein
MVPPLTDVPHDHTVFDLDVRLQPVAGKVSPGSAWETGQNTCGCPTLEGNSCPPQCGP